eukprot:GHVU01182040.1.p4 GENE.GHVU01182040.1~~GHVU01182040.1.p4  ORF type:complete len:128 (+),score=2.44 GHVU01182040.1:78-461(+)
MPSHREHTAIGGLDTLANEGEAVHLRLRTNACTHPPRMARMYAFTSRNLQTPLSESHTHTFMLRTCEGILTYKAMFALTPSLACSLTHSLSRRLTHTLTHLTTQAPGSLRVPKENPRGARMCNSSER